MNNPLRLVFLAALLSASSAYADSAPHWTAAVGTGRASSSTSSPAPTDSTAVPSSAHWSASIGTGRASDASPRSAGKVDLGCITRGAGVDVEHRHRTCRGLECARALSRCGRRRFRASAAVNTRHGFLAVVGLVPFVVAGCSNAVSSGDPRTQAPLVRVRRCRALSRD